MTLIKSATPAKKPRPDAICGDCLYLIVDCNCSERE